MKKYLVIGNPINHSLSPQLHNHWIKKNNIDANYEKQILNAEDLKSVIFKIKENEINGINITVPFKQEVISYLDELSQDAKETRSVNTVYLNNGQMVGHNTDIEGFKLAIKKTDYDVRGKKILILGAGGVVSSIIFALQKMKASEILISNRTISKAENLKNLFQNLTIVNWGQIPKFDMIINATSVGLKVEEKLDLDFSQIEKGKFFYDVIYNPKQTNFLKNAKKLGNKIENGKMMFVYQAAAAFKMEHGIYPNIDDEIDRILD